MRGSNNAQRMVMYALVSLLYGLLLKVLARLDQQLGFRVARCIIPLFMLPVKKRRYENYQYFFGNAPPKAFTDFEKKHMSYQSLLTVESVQLLKLPPKDIRQQVNIVGEEHLHAAMRQRRGGLVISPHSGFGWTMMAALSDFGYAVSLLSNPTPIRAVRSYTESFCKQFHIESIWLGNDASLNIRDVFRKNGICILFYDVAVREKNRVTFPFGYSSLPVDIGTAFVGQRYHVPIVRVTNTIKEDGRTHISIEPPIELKPTHNPRKDSESIMEGLVAQLSEETIRQPEYWWAWSYVVLSNSQQTLKG